MPNTTLTRAGVVNKTIALIPARAGSKGVPNKNIRMLNDKPVLAWTIEAALKTSGIDRTFVTTESSEYATIAKEWGAEVLMRPQELATDIVQSDEVFLYALRQLQYMGADPETLVLLQPTSPFRTSRDIERALELYYEMDMEFTILSGFRSKGYHWTTDDESGFVPVMHNPMQRLGRQAYNETDWLVKESGAIYISNAKAFTEYKTYRVPPFHFYLMSEEESADIDSEADWQAVVRYADTVR